MNGNNEIARLPNYALMEIRRRTRKNINPNVFDPNERGRHYRMNCYAIFNCNNYRNNKRCGNQWSSNKVTVELWWSYGKKEFDVRMYGQRCKFCNRQFLSPSLSYYTIRKIIRICVRILLNNYYNVNGNTNTNENTNREFNNSHDQRRCQKCIILGHPCW